MARNELILPHQEKLLRELRDMIADTQYLLISPTKPLQLEKELDDLERQMFYLSHGISLLLQDHEGFEEDENRITEDYRKVFPLPKK